MPSRGTRGMERAAPLLDRGWTWRTMLDRITTARRRRTVGHPGPLPARSCACSLWTGGARIRGADPRLQPAVTPWQRDARHGAARACRPSREPNMSDIRASARPPHPGSGGPTNRSEKQRSTPARGARVLRDRARDGQRSSGYRTLGEPTRSSATRSRAQEQEPAHSRRPPRSSRTMRDPHGCRSFRNS
jgi:hypothetical protein